MKIKCTQCGGGIPIEEDTEFVRCPFCDTALYLAADRSVRHYYLEPVSTATDLASLIQRRLFGMEIEQGVEVEESKLIYFPFWKLDLPAGGSVSLPASSPPCEDLYSFKMPAGDLKLFDPMVAADHELYEPEVMLEDAALMARQMLENDRATFKTAHLIHAPVYEVVYRLGSESFRAWVDVVSGQVMADEWPAAPDKAKDRLLGWMAVGVFVFFIFLAAVLPGFWLTILFYAAAGAGIYYGATYILKKKGW